MEGKVCTKCGEFKEITNFRKSKNTKSGYSQPCLDCYREDNKKHQKKWRETNKEHYNKYRKEYYEENKDRIKKRNNKYGKKYYEKNKDKLLQKQKKWNEKNKDRLGENLKNKLLNDFNEIYDEYIID